jgi:drug/metabolite transporter (DMT)-like permease
MAPILLPLIAAWLFPPGTLLVRRALTEESSSARGADILGCLAVNCWCMTLVFFTVFPFESRAIPWGAIYQPAAGGLLFFLGQLLAFKAIEDGDLTVSTPALGSKVLLVALLTVSMLRQHVPFSWWVAALLSFAAIFFLQSGLASKRHHALRTLWYSLLASASFALGDVLIQKWSPLWGPFHFLPFLALFAGLYSLALVPFMPKPALRYSRVTWGLLLGGSVFLTLQSFLFTLTIGIYGSAALANIVLSSRGLWNFLLVWFGGRWLGNREREAGRKAMAYRLVGAVLMFAAIVLVTLR